MILEMKHIQKSFGEHCVLKDINLSVGKGEVVSVIGPSGSGKSTLLRCATFLERIDSGEIRYMDTVAASTGEDGGAVYAHPDEMRKINRYFGLVFQQFHLFPHYSVIKNVTDAPIKVQKRQKDEVRAEAMELLKKMNLADRADYYPCQLSGGQQQRVAIARALAADPEIIYFDEPTSALDPELIGEVLGTMKSLADDGMTMIVVTHEMGFARNVSNRVVFLEHGTIIEQAPSEVFFTAPAEERTREFLRFENDRNMAN